MSVALKEAFERLLEQPLGAIVVCLLYWVWKLDQRLTAIQEKRVQDAFKLATSAKACASALDRNTAMLNDLIKK